MLGIVCGTRKIKGRCSVGRSFECVAISILLFVALDHSSIVQLLISLFMIWAVMEIAEVLAGRVQIDRKSIFTQTYSIFILSWPCQLVVEIVLERLLECSFYVTFPCEVVVGVIVPLVIIKLIDLFEIRIHTNVLSMMIGR